MSKRHPDRQLLLALAEGDIAALGRLYDTFAERVYHVLLAQGAAQDVAEDIVQEAFLSLVDRGKALGRIGHVQAYLIATARNMLHRRRRRSRRWVSRMTEALPPAEPESADPTDDIAAREMLKRLPAEQAEVLALKIWHEMTFAEIGEALSIPADTAASRYRYALRKLRALWEDDERGT
jgi:RNA polymerase sigma-70 factor (ECF subfamily)